MSSLPTSMGEFKMIGTLSHCNDNEIVNQWLCC